MRHAPASAGAYAYRGARGVTGLVAALVLALTGCADSPPPADPPAPPAPPASDQPAGEVAVTLTEVAAAEAPTAGVAGPEGTVWIAERPGRVRVLDGDDLGDPVLDISGETTTDGERGLLGLAFDPDFAHLYLSYTDLSGNTVVDELAMVDGAPDLGSRRTVLTQEQPYANHNGGDLTFGPDGMLYFGFGDGGSGGDPHDYGQDMGTFLGKLLRIDPSTGDPYAVPEDNPFVDEPGARPEIWAYGLRNPWRFSFDAQTGDLWIADVGQSSQEEVNFSPVGEDGAGAGAGANYGWSRMEGTENFSGDEPDDHVPPVHQYPTGDRCSITGGYVYRGEAIPALVGSYVFSDYCEGGLRALQLADGEVTGETDLEVDGGSVVAFAQGPDRELYVLDLDGPVYRLDPA